MILAVHQLQILHRVLDVDNPPALYFTLTLTRHDQILVPAVAEDEVRYPNPMVRRYR
jgi:hypothetical protein